MEIGAFLENIQLRCKPTTVKNKKSFHYRNILPELTQPLIKDLQNLLKQKTKQNFKKYETSKMMTHLIKKRGQKITLTVLILQCA